MSFRAYEVSSIKKNENGCMDITLFCCPRFQIDNITKSPAANIFNKYHDSQCGYSQRVEEAPNIAQLYKLIPIFYISIVIDRFWKQSDTQAMSQVHTEQVLTLQELSEYIRIAESSLYKLVREGRIPAKKLGKQWRFHRPTIDLWLAGNSTVSTFKTKQRKGKAS